MSQSVVREIVEWLRGDEAEGIRCNAEDAFIPPEDALADVIERRWLDPKPEPPSRGQSE